MKVAVCVKQVIDTELQVTLADGAPQTQGLKRIMGPFDEMAVEEAIRVVERHGGEVVVFSVDPDNGAEVIRQALAMGADRGVWIQGEPQEAGQAARLVADALRGEDFDLILGGISAPDTGGAQMMARLSVLLDLPFVGQVVAQEVEEGAVSATQEMDSGTRRVRCPLPAVLAVANGINEPRFAGMKGILRAKKKPLDTVAAQPESPALTTLSAYSPLPPRTPGKKLQGEPEQVVAELIALLQTEAKLI